MIRIEVPPNGKFWLAPSSAKAIERDERDDRRGRASPAAVIAGQHVVEVLRGRPAGPDAGDEAAVLLHVVGDLVRVERDRRRRSR